MKKMIRIYWILANRLKLRFLNIQFGKDLRICNRLHLTLGRSANVQIGNNFAFYSGGHYNPLSRNVEGSIAIEAGGRLVIGNNVGISASCLRIYDFLEIGDFVKIGADSIIIDSDAHSLNPIERRAKETDRPRALRKGIVIEEDVLIGTRCIILKGVKIGARSIVGSGSVVTKNIPQDEIWAGNPAKFVRKINT